MKCVHLVCGKDWYIFQIQRTCWIVVDAASQSKHNALRKSISMALIDWRIYRKYFTHIFYSHYKITSFHFIDYRSITLHMHTDPLVYRLNSKNQTKSTMHSYAFMHSKKYICIRTMGNWRRHEIHRKYECCKLLLNFKWKYNTYMDVCNINIYNFKIVAHRNETAK